ncbi:DUF4411 family protein [Calditrichota bacterium LG25]
MPYLIDSNVFIQAKNLHYGFDFCPAFWDWLVESNRAQKVFSIEKVADELLAGNDQLSEWTRERGSDFFLSPDSSVINAFGQVSRWVLSQDYEPVAVNTFLQTADYYLISHALAHGFVVVTHEIPSDSKKRIKIPNVCIGLGIRFMTPYEMLRVERARFVLSNY